MTRRPLTTLLAILLVAVAVFVLWPSPIDPAAWTPPAPPELAGPTAPNQALEEAQRFAEGEVAGPEDVAVDASGTVWAGLEDGGIVRMRLAEDGSVDGEPETVWDTGGRPLGLHFDAEGRLLVADAVAGLLRLDTSSARARMETLTTESDGLPFRFTDDLDVASDGKVYFSDASYRWGHHHYLYDLMEAKPHGRLLAYDPADGSTTTLLDGLYFANGIALSSSEDFVLVNETYRYRITRYWLKGPKRGTSDVFVDNLPCIPDGTSSNRSQVASRTAGPVGFWIACFTERNSRADALHPRPFVKRQMVKLPRFLWPKPAPYGWVIQTDESGNILRSFQDPGGEVIPQVTSAEEHDGWLYLGNLNLDFVARLRLPAAAGAGTVTAQPDRAEPDQDASVESSSGSEEP